MVFGCAVKGDIYEIYYFYTISKCVINFVSFIAVSFLPARSNMRVSLHSAWLAALLLVLSQLWLRIIDLYQ